MNPQDWEDDYLNDFIAGVDGQSRLNSADYEFMALSHAASETYSLFKAYVDAGFTESQALKIILALMLNAQQLQAQQRDH